MNNRSKNEVKMAKHLGIDCTWILVDFGGQVGAKLGSNIDQKSSAKMSWSGDPFRIDFGDPKKVLTLKMIAESFEIDTETARGSFNLNWES